MKYLIAVACAMAFISYYYYLFSKKAILEDVSVLPTSQVHQQVPGNQSECGSNYRRDQLNFWMIWSSSRQSFDVQLFRAIEAVLGVLPDAVVHLLSQTLRQEDMDNINLRGRVWVNNVSTAELFKYTPLAQWNKKMNNLTWHKNYKTQITDGIRVAILYKCGGFYIDFDAIVLTNLTRLINSVGYQEYIRKRGIANGMHCKNVVIGGSSIYNTRYDRCGDDIPARTPLLALCNDTVRFWTQYQRVELCRPNCYH